MSQSEQENYFTRPECSLSNDQISRKDGRNKLWQNIQSETRIFTFQGLLSECGFRTGIRDYEYELIFKANTYFIIGHSVQILRGNQEVWENWRKWW